MFGSPGDLVRARAFQNAPSWSRVYFTVCSILRTPHGLRMILAHFAVEIHLRVDGTPYVTRKG